MKQHLTTTIIVISITLFIIEIEGCKSSSSSGNSGDSTKEIAIRSPDSLEELVYNDYFNSTLQLELARSYWAEFLKSNDMNQNDASQSMTAYLVAGVESSDNDAIVSEFKAHYETIDSMDNKQLPSFEKTYDGMKGLINAVRPDLDTIFSLRNDFRSLHIENGANSDTALKKAYGATMRQIRIVYNVTTGRETIIMPSGGKLILSRGFYINWSSGLRGYGLILPELNDLGSNFAILSNLDSSFPSDAIQSTNGSSNGFYILPNGNVVAPGIKYFKDILQKSN